MAKSVQKNNGSTANIGFEAKLWLAADKLRNNMDAAEYKPIVLGLIFFKYISGAFEEMHTKLVEGKQSCALAVVHNTLLPKLLSGELQIKAQEQLAAELQA